ncbi:YdcF family protein [Polynucleobacter sp. AP-Melu-500A-A1]|uniref:YdcF family protein n=1 Tax=Polynucleobacter sp. AP-Melu-500A-A1 TaxID=2576929 RepID=UPI001C0B268E|nr:YdcF family protein [Polynucleobacter sp. AP-Melu-500A-A1]MBU3629962.1 YdcF family protein [Polynucleobacter sp. AP-Melu-500A-A1]
MDTIFFILSKAVQFCIEPLNWVLFWVVLALLFLLLRKIHLAKRFLWISLFNLALVGYLPTSEFLLRALENSAPRINLSQVGNGDLGGMIILGGAIEGGEIATDRGEVSIYSSAERVTKAFELIRKYPDLPLIFSGYSGRINPKGVSEADAFKQLIQEQGLDGAQVYYENQSRNTYENVLYLKPMMQELGGKTDAGLLKPWLVISSASHMYRSLQIFQKQGIDVLALPVDYQTANSLQWTSFDLVEGAQNWNKALHELIGLLAYWITGKL